jgi:hypothetical protein
VGAVVRGRGRGEFVVRRALPILIACLAASPAGAGLSGQSVTLNGVTAVIGDGVEFSGISRYRPFTVDFTADGVTIALDNGGVPSNVAMLGGTEFSFSFAEPVVLAVSVAGGNIAAPTLAVPPGNPCEGLPPGSYCSGFTLSPPPFSSTFSFDATTIDIYLFAWQPENPVDTVSFAIATPAAVSAVPAPASALLLAGAVGGLAAIRRRPG